MLFCFFQFLAGKVPILGAFRQKMSIFSSENSKISEVKKLFFSKKFLFVVQSTYYG